MLIMFIKRSVCVYCPHSVFFCYGHVLWVKNKYYFQLLLVLFIHCVLRIRLGYLKGVQKKTFTNVNTALNVLFSSLNGIFFIKVFVYYIYEWFIINFAFQFILTLCRIEGLMKIVAKSSLTALNLPDFLNISGYSL